MGIGNYATVADFPTNNDTSHISSAQRRFVTTEIELHWNWCFAAVRGNVLGSASSPGTGQTRNSLEQFFRPT